MTTPAVVLAVIAGLTGTAAPVSAGDEGSSRAVLRDPAGDVWRVNTRTSEAVKAGRIPHADVRRAAVAHTRRAVVVRMRFSEPPPHRAAIVVLDGYRDRAA